MLGIRCPGIYSAKQLGSACRCDQVKAICISNGKRSRNNERKRKQKQSVQKKVKRAKNSYPRAKNTIVAWPTGQGNQGAEGR